MTINPPPIPTDKRAIMLALARARILESAAITLLAELDTLNARVPLPRAVLVARDRLHTLIYETSV